MTNAALLEAVKLSLGITGNHQDETLNFYISEVLNYLSDAGVADSVLQSSNIIGIVTRGVADLWNYGAGNSSFSLYFMQRATQLAYKEG